MTRSTTLVHRALLGFSAVLLGSLALLVLVSPAFLVDRVVDLADSGPLEAMLRLAGAAMLGEAVAVVLALRSRDPSLVRLVSLMLIVHFTVETVARVGSYVGSESSTLVPAVPQAMLAVGLAIEVWRSRFTTRRASSTQGVASA